MNGWRGTVAVPRGPVMASASGVWESVTLEGSVIGVDPIRERAGAQVLKHALRAARPAHWYKFMKKPRLFG